MPPKIRDLDSNVLQMSGGQRRLYNSLVEESMAELPTEGLIATPSILAKLQRLRQVLATPKLLDSALEDGAGIDRIVEMLDEASDQHMVIFCPFVRAQEFIRARLENEGYKDIITLHGGLSAEELGAKINYFRLRRGICICSTKYAESFDLIPATWAVCLGFEWDCYDNIQAEDRLHRGDISESVSIYYLRHEGAIDSELILPAVDVKANNVMPLLRELSAVKHLLRKV
jgi:SNF2 family DNA or RNA helicase